jgi:LPS-assembly lipoprotein
MSSPEALTRRAALLGCLALGGCGFTPAYAPGGGATALRGKVALTTATDSAFDYRLRTALEDRLGRSPSPLYDLRVETRIDEVSAAITSGGSVTRFNLSGRADFVLTEGGTGVERASGNVSSFTGYSATGTTVATRAAADDARERLAVMLADLIVNRLITASAGW